MANFNTLQCNAFVNQKSYLQLYIAELENQSDIFPSLTQIQPDSQNLKQNTKISFKLKDK